jgi:hypothetical protein
LQKIEWMASIFLQIQPSQIDKFSKQIKGLRVFQRELNSQAHARQALDAGAPDLR